MPLVPTTWRFRTTLRTHHAAGSGPFPYRTQAYTDSQVSAILPETLSRLILEFCLPSHLLEIEAVFVLYDLRKVDPHTRAHIRGQRTRLSFTSRPDSPSDLATLLRRIPMATPKLEFWSNHL